MPTEMSVPYFFSGVSFYEVIYFFFPACLILVVVNELYCCALSGTGCLIEVFDTHESVQRSVPSRELSVPYAVNIAVVQGLIPAVISRPVNTSPPAASRWFGLKDVCCGEPLAELHVGNPLSKSHSVNQKINVPTAQGGKSDENASHRLWLYWILFLASIAKPATVS